MPKKIATIGDKLKKVSDTFTVNMYDNGFMLEIAGHDYVDNWSSAKIMCATVEELLSLIQAATIMERE